MKKVDLDIVIDVEEHLRSLNKQIRIIHQHCSTNGIGGQKYLYELYICFKQHIQAFSKEIYTDLLTQKSKTIKEYILVAGQQFLPIYEQSMREYNFGCMINVYDKAGEDIQLYQSKLEGFLARQADKFSKKHTSHNKPFWKKLEFWSIVIPSIIGLLALIQALI